MKRLALILCAAALAAASATPALADVVFNKPPWVSGYQSEFNPAIGLVESYDHFTLGEDTTLTNIAWSGSGQLDSSYFIVAIFADNNGSPGILINSSNAGHADGAYTTDNGGVSDYDYITATDFSASANTTYWLSIYSVNSINYPWYWDDSLTGDKMAQTYIPAGYEDPLPAGFYPLHDDLAFTLLGAATVHTPPPPPPAVTPEPASLVLTGTGMIAMVGAARKKFARP